MTKEKETKCDDLIDALLEEHGISQEAVVGEDGSDGDRGSAGSERKL